jgi:two-component system sensor histidine kinase/response regulator
MVSNSSSCGSPQETPRVERGDEAAEARWAVLKAKMDESLAPAASLRQGMQRCVEVLSQSLQGELVGIWTISSGEKTLELIASAGSCTSISSAEAGILTEKSALGHVVEAGEPLLLNSPQDGLWFGEPEWADSKGLCAFAGYPLKAGDRVLGVVAAFASQPLPDATLKDFAAASGSMSCFIEQKRAEESLRESEIRFRTAFEEAPNGICLTGLDGRFLQANAALCQMLGYSEGELVAGVWQKITHPDDMGRSVQAAIRLRRGDVTSEEFEKRYIHKTGRVIWVRLKISVVKNSLGHQSHYITHIDDITERKAAEWAVQESESRYRSLFERNVAGALITTREGRILECNQSMARMLGYDSPNELAGSDICSIWNDPSNREKMISLLIEHKSLSNHEVYFRRKDGQPVCALVNVHLTEPGGGKNTNLESTIFDITMRKQAEQKLLLTQFSIDHASDAIIWLDREGRIVYGNKAACDSLGRSREELLSLSISDINPDFPPGGWESEWERVRAARSTSLEAQHITKLGRTFPVEVTANYQEFDRAEYVFSSIRDITLRKDRERQMKLQATALDAAANGIVITNAAGEIEWVNPAFTRLTSYQPQEVVGRHTRILKSGKQESSFYRELWNTIRSGKVWQGELINRRKDGSIYSQEMTITPLRDAQGTISHYIAINQDITERKEWESELRLAKEAAEAASRAKSEFLANMSHEIRTPMNGIIGMTELALDTTLTSEQRDYLTMVKTSADSLLTLINDVLDFSKIEAGKFSLDSTEFNLQDVLTSTLRLLSIRASDKGLEIAWTAKPGVPERVIGDEGRVRQVIVNLVGNAIKFTSAGEVVVSVEVQSASERDVVMHFAVQDTGIGIAPEKQKVIFEAFMQADNSMTRKYGGTGLGLTISSRLVQMMGGNIWIESAPGQGSTFHFTARLGLPQDAAEIPQQQAVVTLHGLPVLVIDDNSTNRKILEAMLKQWSMLPDLASSGAEGLSALERAAAAGEPYPLVLLDAQMPEMDGFALASQVRQNPRLAGATIMMLTSAGQRGEAARCRELGIAVYLIKPIRKSELLEAMLAALGKSPAANSSATLITRHTLLADRRKLQILLAEDNFVNQRLAVRLLERRGHNVTVAADGGEALALLKHSKFDLVLMDVQMPVMDGFEATAAIRLQEASSGSRLPIIAMTAHAVQGDHERCLAAGMDAYIAKPIDGDELTQMVERIGSSGLIRNAIARPAGAIFDREEALSRLLGDQELLAELAGVFLKDYMNQLADIRQALREADLLKLEHAAHSLKGAVANFGAQRSFSIAFELEKAARNNDFSSCPQLSGELAAELEILRPELAKLAGKS